MNESKYKAETRTITVTIDIKPSHKVVFQKNPFDIPCFCQPPTDSIVLEALNQYKKEYFQKLHI